MPLTTLHAIGHSSAATWKQNHYSQHAVVRGCGATTWSCPQSIRVDSKLGAVARTGSKGAPEQIVKQIRKYIPAEALALWAAVKQILDIVFIDGSINTLQEVNTFALAWAGFVLCVGAWQYWLLRRQRQTLEEDPADSPSNSNMIKHALLSAFAFALYTISFGSHSEIFKQALGSLGWMTEKMFKSLEGMLMMAFPVLLQLFGKDDDTGKVVA